MSESSGALCPLSAQSPTQLRRAGRSARAAPRGSARRRSTPGRAGRLHPKWPGVYAVGHPTLSGWCGRRCSRGPGSVLVAARPRRPGDAAGAEHPRCRDPWRQWAQAARDPSPTCRARRLRGHRPSPRAGRRRAAARPRRRAARQGAPRRLVRPRRDARPHCPSRRAARDGGPQGADRAARRRRAALPLTRRAARSRPDPRRRTSVLPPVERDDRRSSAASRLTRRSSAPTAARVAHNVAPTPRTSHDYRGGRDDHPDRFVRAIARLLRTPG